jgi:hypothetical protein
MIRVEPEVQPFTDDSSARAKAVRPKAKRVKPIQLAAPAPGEGLQARAEGKTGVPLQIGFNRNIPGFDDEAATVSALEWEEQLGGGHLAAISINSPGAAALRVGLVVNRVNPAATFRFYGPDDAKLFEVSGQEILDLIARNLESGENGRAAHTYWSPVIESATIVMEIELPAGAKTSELRISAPEISHLVTSSRMDFQVPKVAAACEIDAMCQVGTWGTQMNAVARMIFTEPNVGSFLCTGTLLADQDPNTSVPYFLSANHCISSSAAASSLETYWFYRSSACNSGVLGSSMVHQTGGATLLYASATTDTSFMRLNAAPPGGAVFAGWAVSPVPAVGAATTAIHHPTGDLLKISFGGIQGYWNCTPPTNGSFSCSGSNSTSGTFYANTLTSGITEPGSSGSGLFLNNGHYLIGQLYGGSSSCSNPGTDFYGRLDIAYTAGLSAWLGAVQTLTVTRSGAGTGSVVSSPSGINCGSTCTASYAPGTVVSLTPTPGSGWAFTGWSGACSGTGSCSVTMSAARNVDASFGVAGPTPPPSGPPSLTITKAGTGTGLVTSSPEGFYCGSACSSAVLSGTVITLSATPSTGSTFTGWSGACAGTGSCTLTITSALTATANFNSGTAPPPQYALSVTRSGSGTGTVTSSPAGINCGATCSVNFAQGTSVTLTATPSSGSTFAGWSGACLGLTTCMVTMNAATSVEAVFAVTTTTQYPLTVSRSGTGTGTVTSTPAGINCGATCSANFNQGTSVSLTATPASGSTFTGWSGACSGTGSCSVTLSAAASVGANFNLTPPPSGSPSLLITKAGTGAGRVTSSPEGFDCGTACFSDLLANTVLTLIATPGAGSTFTGWSGACSGMGNCTLTINSAVTVTANFNSGTAPPPTQFGLSVTRNGTGTGTVTSSPAGINCGATCSANFNQGTMVSLTPTPASGSTFTGWSGACSGTGSCVVTLNAAASVGAAFTISTVTQFPLTVTRSGTGTGTVTSTPAGISCGATCSANFDQGTLVSLTATPASGSTFTGWSGACSGTGSCSVTLNAAASVGAAFTLAAPPSGSPSLLITKAGNGTGRVTSSPEGFDCGSACFSDLLANTVLTLIATPNAGSTFTGWSGACSGTGNCTLTINSALVATANFNSGTAPPPAQFTLSIAPSGTGTGTVTSSPAGINCGGMCSTTFAQGTSVTLTATPASGSAFGGWSGACSGTGTCTVTMNAATSVGAVFTATGPPPPPTGTPSLTIVKAGAGRGVVTSSPEGFVCGTACFSDVLGGTVLTLIATPNSGSMFAGWSGACTGTGTCNLIINSALTVTATFQ